MQNELKYKFRQLLPGYNFTEEQLRTVKHDLRLALADLTACLECDWEVGGKLQCKTTANQTLKFNSSKKGFKTEYTDKTKLFFSLYYYDSEQYKKPMFRMFECPGILGRKAELEERLGRVS